MSLSDELQREVKAIFKSKWETREGRVVPSPEDLKMSNEAVHLERATVLYADLSDSTDMVDQQPWWLAAEVYRAYLYCCSRLIRAEGGTITSYDGDRVMGIFVGDKQTTTAARCALKINYAVKQIINPLFKDEYKDRSVTVRQVVGIDTSEIHAARAGVRGDNDIVWVGRAANYAAKLTSESADYPTWITEQGFNRLADEAKYGGANKELMWKKWSWTKMGGITIYSSTWWWKVN